MAAARILVVDDDVETRQLLGEELRDPAALLATAQDLSEQNAVRETDAASKDGTGLNRVKRELEESQALHRVVIESSRDLIAVLDLEGTIRLVSRSAENLLGYTQQELLGRPFGDLVHPEDLEDAAKALRDALSSEESALTVVRVRTSDGSYRLLEGIASAGFGLDSIPTFIVISSRDVTERVRLEQHVRDAQKMEAVGRLAGGVAHDFNNLLMVIRGYGEQVRRRVGRGEDVADDLEEMLAAVARAADLTGQLLALGRRQVLDPEALDLGEALSETTELLRRLIGEDIELQTTAPSEPVLVRVDRTQIEQVIVNLAVNARDAVPNGGRISIEVAVGPTRADALLRVTDNGPGIDAETAAQIFEPFFTTKGAQGTGLGLATVHGIVTQSGGEITVQSELGRGTTFEISLPRIDFAP